MLLLVSSTVRRLKLTDVTSLFVAPLLHLVITLAGTLITNYACWMFLLVSSVYAMGFQKADHDGNTDK